MSKSRKRPQGKGSRGRGSTLGGQAEVRPRVSEEVLEGIEAHVKSDTEREVGGILVGSVTDSRAEVDAWIPALKAVGGRANVTFTHDVWSDVHAELESEHPGKSIVGWYHSHPGFGVFLSEYDLFIHRNFFAGPSMVAYVVDPLAGTTGWFGWQSGEVRLVQEGKIDATAPKRPVASVPKQRSDARSGGLGILVGAAVVIAAFVGGYVLGAPEDGVERPVATATGSLAPGNSDGSSEEALLRARILDLRGALREARNALRHPVLLYEVQRGDTLWSISERFLGDGFDFRKIKRANAELLRDGLEPGSVLRIQLPGLSFEMSP